MTCADATDGSELGRLLDRAVAHAQPLSRPMAWKDSGSAFVVQQFLQDHVPVAGQVRRRFYRRRAALQRGILWYGGGVHRQKRGSLFGTEDVMPRHFFRLRHEARGVVAHDPVRAVLLNEFSVPALALLAVRGGAPRALGPGFFLLDMQ